jgi:hypothetical protein
MLSSRCKAAAILTLSLLSVLPFSAQNVRADESTVTADGIRPSTEGFYPLWENTGFVEKAREIYLGTNGAHFGIEDVAHVGVQPINFAYRAPNGYVKFSLLQRGRWHVSGQVGGFYLMNEASRAFLSPMYTSRLDNPDFSVTLIPVSLTATLEVSDWMQLHQTATTLGVFCPSGQIENSAYLGYTAVAELLAKRRHSVLLHAGEVGFWNHDFSLLGTSYRYHNSWMDFQVGYFYRFRQDGNQSAPMISLGFLI